MATTQAQWDKAFTLLQKFERQLIEPSVFCWKYITDQTGVSKATLWRNKEFESEFQRVKALVKAYDFGEKKFDQEKSIKAAKERNKDRQIEELKARVEDLNQQLSRERERLIYASLIARQKNIDPADFMENSPLNRKIGGREKVTPIVNRKKADANNSK